MSTTQEKTVAADAETRILDGKDHLAIERIMNRYFRLIDIGRASEVAAFYMPDGQMTFGPGSPKPGTFKGNSIAAFLAARQAQTTLKSRHAISNIALEARPDGSVAGYSLVTLYRTDGPNTPCTCLVADVEDVFVRHDSEWRIAERSLMPVFTVSS